MKIISPSRLNAYSVTALGLAATECDLTTIEAIASAIRRAAIFLCPCSRRTLRDAVIGPLRGLGGEQESLRDLVDLALESVIAYGDLLEETEVETAKKESRGTLLNISPPSFVWRRNHSAFIVGSAPDHPDPLPPDLKVRIDVRSHTRRLREQPGEDLRMKLEGFGLTELGPDEWLQVPEFESSGAHLDRQIQSLRPMTGDLPGLIILNPTRPVRFYKGRWTESKNQTGRFVARRPQAYGNDIWCYVELSGGRPVKIRDFPVVGSKWRGCDEAWLLQAAIDAERGEPQQFRVRVSLDPSKRVVQFFSPVPMWARKRWDVLGELAPSSGCLFSYVFPANEFDEEVSFMTERLWLTGPA